MPVWKLTPLDLNHPEWRASVCRGEVFVRASSEHRAREIAGEAFGIATARIPGARTIMSPWEQAAVVSAREVTDKDHLDAGKEGIVGPDNALGHVESE